MRGELPDDYEIALTSRFALEFVVTRGNVFVDVGAHCGTWTIQLAHLFDHVVAFEPHPSNFVELLKNAPDNVSLWPGALSDVEGRSELYLYDSPGHSALGESPVMGNVAVTGRLLVDTMRLDDWDFPGVVDLIKIDTEGHEMHVLRGAAETIKRDRPKLCIENHSLEMRREALDFLSTLGINDVRIWPDEPRRHPTEGGYLVRF